MAYAMISVKRVVLDAMGVVYEVGDDVNDLLVPYVQELRSQITPDYVNEIYMQAQTSLICAI